MLNSICDCSAQDRHTVTDCCRFRVHRGTDQWHTKSRGKPRQHTATKSSTTMKGSSEARTERHRATPSLSFFTLDGNTEPSKASFFFFLLHCNKHTNTERNTKWPRIVECVCLRTHAHSDTRNTHTAGCESAVLGGFTKKKKTGVLGFCAARAGDTHMRVLRCFCWTASTQRTHTEESWGGFEDSSSRGHTPSEEGEEGRKGVWGGLETGTAADT